MKPRPVVCTHLSVKNKLDFVEKIANKAKELGAEYVRLDIWWNEIMPEPGKISLDNLIKWGEIIGKLRSKDLEIIAILGTGYGSFIYRYPDWVVKQVLTYLSCLYTCPPEPLGGNMSKTFNTSQYNVSRELEERIRRSYIESLKRLVIDDIMKIMDYVKKTYPVMYKRLEYSKLENIYNQRRTISNKLGAIGDPSELLNIWDRCKCYRIMEDLMEKAYQYSKTVASSFGQDIDYYQLGNELNHPIDLIPFDWDAVFIYWLSQGLYEDPSDHIGIINVFADWFYWDRDLKSWLETLKNLPADTIGIIAIDHYPGTWGEGPFDNWEALDKLINIASKYDKKSSIMETGYPTQGNDHNEDKQAEYINKAFNAIMKRAKEHDIEFLSWYMLWDEPGSGEVRYDGWGVLRRDFSKKPGWYTLHDWFINLT